MAGPELVEVRVSAPTAEVAEALAAAVVRSRLAACAQVLGPMTSTYWWEGEVRSDTEHLVLIKTARRLFGPLADRVRAEHPYETPEILAVPVTAASEPYAAWLAAAVRQEEPPGLG